MEQAYKFAVSLEDKRDWYPTEYGIQFETLAKDDAPVTLIP